MDKSSTGIWKIISGLILLGSANNLYIINTPTNIDRAVKDSNVLCKNEEAPQMI